MKRKSPLNEANRNGRFPHHPRPHPPPPPGRYGNRNLEFAVFKK
ncbi:MAG: hypothetical protein M5U34_43700 [Chloroflexi bacterium]|nr:hypothetical protein [Chloroflexota bacterium]